MKKADTQKPRILMVISGNINRLKFVQFPRKSSSKPGLLSRHNLSRRTSKGSEIGDRIRALYRQKAWQEQGWKLKRNRLEKTFIIPEVPPEDSELPLLPSPEGFPGALSLKSSREIIAILAQEFSCQWMMKWNPRTQKTFELEVCLKCQKSPSNLLQRIWVDFLMENFEKNLSIILGTTEKVFHSRSPLHWAIKRKGEMVFLCAIIENIVDFILLEKDPSHHIYLREEGAYRLIAAIQEFN